MNTPTRVLIVDDKEENLYYLQALLTGHGFVVDPARHGAEALVKARQYPPDIIISDLLMPVMDGYTLLLHWKADTRLKRVPFIVYTATYTEPEDERLALSLGADAFILKPAEPEDFLARFREVQANAAAPAPAPPREPSGDENNLLKVYSETLIRKLEEKTIQLQESNNALQRDIAERKLVEVSLRESEERFQQIAVNINEVFWISDTAKDRILYVSPAYEKIWGQPCAVLYANARAWSESIHPDDRERVLQAALTRQVDGTYDEEYRVLRPDKSIRWIRDRAFPVHNQSGEVERIVGVARDITENRKLEEQLRQVQKMEAIGQLASGVAHDFNNILAVISMQAGLLPAEGDLTPAQASLVNEMEAAVQRASGLTRQLLMFSRRQTMQPRNLDLNAVVVNVSKMLQRILGEDIDIQYNIAAQPLYLNADAGMMDQVLMNFTVNARDAMPGGGRLIIRTSAVEFDETAAAQSPQMRPGRFVCLSVSDTGCGIAPENMTRIFEPFFTTKDVGKGTGLGLATVFGIVQQHQGWINVSSEVGQGTTFNVHLPRILRRDEEERSQAGPPSAFGGEETILVAEDDPALRTVVRLSLVRLGYRVLEASTGAGAIEAWQQNRDEVRLLLTDLVMPDGMNGKELARRLQGEKSGLKVIYTSGYSAEVAGKDLSLEEDGNFIAKPFNAYKLAQMIRAKLDARA